MFGRRRVGQDGVTNAAVADNIVAQTQRVRNDRRHQRDVARIDLAELLRVSRRNNERAGVTGLLLHHDGQFMQVLEGPEPAVRSVLSRISADPRHSGVWILDEERIAERRFGAWAMAYRPTSDAEVRSLPGFNDSILDEGSRGATWLTASPATALLDWFRAR